MIKLHEWSRKEETLHYGTADAQLQGRNKESRKIGNNTYLKRREDHIAVRLHATDVVKFYPGGRVELNTGGWYTVTTKARINDALDFWNVYSDKGRWLVQHGRSAEIYAFADGMVIHTADGSVEGAGRYTPAEDRALKRRVKAYAQLCADSLPLDPPGAGDCWYCYMETEDGRALGEAFEGNEHLDSHMSEDEKYIVPSLVFRALKMTGAGDAYYWGAFKQETPDGMLILTRREGGGGLLDATQDQVKRAVYRYIMRLKGFSV